MPSARVVAVAEPRDSYRDAVVERMEALGLLEKIATEQRTLLFPDQPDEARPVLRFGLACWQKGDDMRTLLRSALRDLQNGAD